MTSDDGKAKVKLHPSLDEKLRACEAMVTRDLLAIEESIDEIGDGVVTSEVDPTADTSVVNAVEQLDSTVKRVKRESNAMPMRTVVAIRR